jgi:hypothetical protein
MGFHFLHQGWAGKMQRRRDEFLSGVGKVGFAVIDNRYKLIANLRGEAARLYDVVDDPAETNDLAPTHPEIVSRLQDWRKRWWASVVDDQRKLGIEIDPETLQPRPPE